MSNGNHSNLFVFHQAIAAQGRLWCGVTENHSWETDALVPNTGMTASPSAVEFNGKVYCFHQGFAANGTLYFNVYDGILWEGDRQVPATGMSEGPSVVADNGRLYCFHQGSGQNGQLWFNVLRGGSWDGDEQVPNTGMSKSPSAVVFNNQIYCFHQGSGENGQLWYNVFDLTRGWLGDTQVPTTGMSESPAAVVFNGLLYCFHQGTGRNGQLWYNIFDGHNWLGDRLVPGSGMSKSPSAAVLDGMLYVFYQGAYENGGLYYNVFNGNQWFGQAQVPNTGMSEAPAVVHTDLPPVPSVNLFANPAETRVAAFDGWGTSLCWWANQYGSVGGEFGATMLADLFFGTGNVVAGGPSVDKPPTLPGLGMNIVRYNIGGGGNNAQIDNNTKEVISPNNPVGNPHYMTGFWKKWGDGDSNVNDPQYWDWTADPGQRAMLTLARDRDANIFEFFSNSPPWWMCDNHCASGGVAPVISNLQTWNHGQFARYLATVVNYARDNWKVDIRYVEPFNEPTPGVWMFDIPGHGFANQEGCNFPYPIQTTMISALHDALGAEGLLQTVGIAASDETGVPEALATVAAFTASTDQPFAKISKINVHGYSGTDTNPYRGTLRPNLRNAVRASAPNAKLWMSEFGDGDASGMTMATSIMLDMTELQPTAWVEWQVIDPSWGFFANPDKGGVIGAVYAKYYVFAQFSRHVRQGCHVIGNTDPNSIVAYDPGARKLIIVTLNLDHPRWVSYDLSALSRVAGPVDRWETTTVDGHTAKGYVHTTDTVLSGKALHFRCEANSVYTFEIANVSL
jgi:galactan endo-1,6-beta-galactosidase